MSSQIQTETGAQLLSAIALFCYAASLAALLAIAYSLIELSINAAGQQIGALYSPHAM